MWLAVALVFYFYSKSQENEERKKKENLRLLWEKVENIERNLDTLYSRVGELKAKDSTQLERPEWWKEGWTFPKDGA